VALVSALCASSALGAINSSGGFTYVTKHRQVSEPPTQISRAFEAPCPRGTHVYGGGTYNDQGFGDVVVGHSAPLDGGDKDRRPDDGWKAVLNYLDAMDVYTYAICAAPEPRYERTEVEADGAVISWSLPCDKPGEWPISGGTTGSSQVVEIDSYPSPVARQWEFAVYNASLTSPTLKATAVCAKLDVTLAQHSVDVDPDEQESAFATCDGKRRIVGGGQFVPNDNGHIFGAASRPIGTGTPGTRGWESWVDNYGDFMQGFTAYGVCAKPLKH